MALDQDTVRRIAALARIRVAEGDIEPLVGELNSILDWVEQLSTLDTDKVPPMVSAVEVVLPRRTDAIADGDCRDAVLKNAPETRDGFFTVPKMLE